jgi:hypothetical protein
MSAARMIWLALAVAAATACYRPNIKDGGLGCSEAGTCPEGFVCSKVDQHCWAPDAGPSCPANKPPVTALCQDPPTGGSVCNPTCQTGCACGRCAVIGNVTQCVAVGTKAEGDVCNLASDDCGIGLGCFPESCGTNLARCRRFCPQGVDCSRSILCSTAFGPAFVCDDVPVQTCDPVAGTGCPAGFSCYVRGIQTACECAGSVAIGQPCNSDTQCVPGGRCIALVTGQQAHCFQVCPMTGASNCTPPATCQAIGGGFGFCN